jgi:tetratricopeptide (TPR) repeat protein
MSGCQDPRIAHLLSAYELGMLRDEERREVELHLLDCDACYAELRQFQHAVRLLKQDRDVRQAVRLMAQEPEESVSGLEEKTPRHGAWSRPITALLVAAAAMLLLILQPWEVEFHPTQEAVAVGPRLAIMYLENLADREDEQRLGEIAANLLITDLSESGHLQVVSGQRLYDILKLFGREGQKQVDRETARQIADTAGANIILQGSILQVEPYYVLTANLVDVRTGNVLAAQHVTGDAHDDIFVLVDRLTAKIKLDLALPAAAETEPDRQVAEVTTHSPDAYRYYLQGIELLQKYYHREAAENFHAAVALDSTFAMAFYYLAELEDGHLIDQAMLYINHAGQKERHLIRSRHAVFAGDAERAIAELQDLIKRYPDEKTAHYRLGLLYDARGDYAQAVGYLETALTIDPMYQQAINRLAYTYDRMGRYEDAIGAINRYLALSPNEPNPYDTRGDIYARNGKVDQAIESYRQALEIKPDFTASLYNLGHMYVMKHECELADSAYRMLTIGNDTNNRSLARIYLPYPAFCRGQFVAAIEVIDSALAIDSTDGLADARSAFVGCKHFVKSRALMEQGKAARAIEEYERYAAIYLQTYPDAINREHGYYVQLLAEAGELPHAAAVAESLKVALEQEQAVLDPYWHARGAVGLFEGNPTAAIAAFQQISAASMDYPKQFLLARAYLEAGQLAEAAAAFEALLVNYSSTRAFWCIWDTKVRYYLGRVYEESRWYGKAVIQFEEFLKIWKDADPGIPELDDARERLVRLKQQS